MKNYIISEIKCPFPNIFTEFTEVSLDRWLWILKWFPLFFSDTKYKIEKGMPQLITLYLEEWLVYVVPTYKLKEKNLSKNCETISSKTMFSSEKNLTSFKSLDFCGLSYLRSPVTDNIKYEFPEVKYLMKFHESTVKYFDNHFSLLWDISTPIVVLYLTCCFIMW